MRVVVAIALLSVLAGCASKQEGANLDPSLALLIPSDTTTMVSVRLDLLQKTPVYKNHFANTKIPQIDQFAETTGINMKNLWEVLFVSNGKQGAVLGRGMFSDESEPRMDHLTKQGAKRFGYKGFNLVGDDQNAVLLVSPTVMAAGPTPMLKQIVDEKDKSTGPTGAMAALLKDIPHESQLWAVYAGGPMQFPFPVTGNLTNANRILSLVQTGSVYFDLRMGLKGVATGNAASDADSQQLEGALKGLLGLGRLSTPTNQPDLQKIFDGFRVTNEAKHVKLYVDEPEELVEKLAGLANSFQR